LLTDKLDVLKPNEHYVSVTIGYVKPVKVEAFI